jgi:hypothetical protein
MAYNPKCDGCGSQDRVAIFHSYSPWDAKLLCWPCRKPLIYDRVFPDRDEDGKQESGPERSGQSSISDW